VLEERFPELAKELVRLPVDLIAVLAVQGVTQTSLHRSNPQGREARRLQDRQVGRPNSNSSSTCKRPGPLGIEVPNSIQLLADEVIE
jgi:hypothetical protein